MWTDTKSKEARDALVQDYLARKQRVQARFQAERIGDADLQFEAAKLFQPITSVTTDQVNKQTAELEKVTQAIRQLPELLQAAEAPEKNLKALPDPTLLVDPDKGLDIETIKRYGFIAPSELDLNNDEAIDKIIDKINNTNKYKLGSEKRKAKTDKDLEVINHDQDALRGYRERLRTLRKSHELVVEPQQRTGSGLKMKGNQFGILSIDPIALQAGKLQAYNGGQLVLEAPADASLHDLLTKRFVKTKQYSPLAVDTFKKLVELAGLPIHGRKSKKHKLIRKISGGAVQFYNDPEQLVERLRLLVASKEAGNTGVDNEISAILDELMRTGAISKDLVIQLNKSLLSI